MRKILIILTAVMMFPYLNGQDGLEKWDQEILSKANTAKNSGFLNDEEKKLIFLANLARIDGELFANTILDNYLEGKKSSRYTKSLYRDLKKISNLPLFMPEHDLFKIAEEHAVTAGKKGTTGHQRFEKRYGPLLGKYNEVAENIAYGYDSALDILIQLLIDEDIPDLGHRHNLLSPNFNAIGVAIKSHKKYRHNCVMSFGKKLK